MAGRFYDQYRTEYEAPQNHRLDSIPEAGSDEEYHPSKAHRGERLRMRLNRRESPDPDLSDYSESEEETPRGRNKRKAPTGRGGKSKPVLTDEDGNVLSPAEAKRIRKRATNRESARRMRLQRKEEHNNLQQEVHSKTVALARATQMNQRINEDHRRLVAKIRVLENAQSEHLLLQAHSNTMDAAVRQFCGPMLANLSAEVDPKMADFLSIIRPLLGSPVKAKGMTPNTINITANSTGASFKGLEVAKILPDAETPRCYVEQSNRHYHSDDSPHASLAESYHAKIEDVDHRPTGPATAPMPEPAEPKKLAIAPLPCMEQMAFPVAAPLPLGHQGSFGMHGGLQLGGLPHGDMHSQLDSMGYPRHQQVAAPIIRLDGTSGSGLWSANSFTSMDQLLLSKQLSVGSIDFNSWIQAAEQMDGLGK